MRKHVDRRRRMTLSALVWARKLWVALDTAVSLSMTILDRYGEYEQLVKKAIDPRDYQTAYSFYLDYQAVKVLSKFPYLDTKIDLQAEAQKKFLEAEVQCTLTNDRFRGWKLGLREFNPTSGVSEILYLASQKIATILGPVPGYEKLDFRFGPGACFGVRGDTSVYKKLTQPLECTFAFTPILSDFLAEFPGWIPEGSVPVDQVPGSELTFVPKDAKTDRPICIEPLLNGLYQKGVGSYIRNRLLRHGVNLRDQTVNQRLASLALDLDLCTVDFASASDTIAYMLVLELLPIDWLEFLDVARSPSFLSEGNWYDFQKFTSMGNAYTFELESMIFFALACASCAVSKVPYETGKTLSVYGDDVIIPKAAYGLFLEACSFSGFTINQAKSFTSGVFYESCGTDWFLGSNVRPLLLKKRPESLMDLYYVSNGTLNIADRISTLGLGSEGNLHSRRISNLRELHAWCVGCIPRDWRLLVPKGAGEVGLHADFDVAVPSRHECWDGWEIRTVCSSPRRVKESEWPMSLALYWAGDGSHEWWASSSEILHSEGYALRKSVGRVRKVKSFVQGQWDNLPVKWSERAISLVVPNTYKAADSRPKAKGVKKAGPVRHRT